MWAFTLLICLETSFVVETHRSVEQPELEGLAEVVTHGPVLNHPPVLEPPDVDLLGCELPPSRLPAEELAGVASMHHDPSDDLFSLADLVLDLEAHRSPELTQPGDRRLQALGPLRAAGRGFVVDELRVNQLVRCLEIALLEHLLEQPSRCSRVLLRHPHHLRLDCSRSWSSGATREASAR